MIREPYIEAKIVDASQVPNISPNTDYNVVTFLASPTGPLKMQKIRSTNELIEKYLTREKILSTDHTTIIHAYKLLSTTPLNVLRVDSCKILTGLNDKGQLMYFDRDNYSLIDTLSKFDITPDETYDVVFLVDQTGNKVYYAGDLASIPSDYNAYDKIKISDNANIDELKGLFNITQEDNIFFGFNNLTSIDFGDISSYITNASKNKLKAAFKRLRINNLSYVVPDGTYINIGTKDYYLYFSGLIDYDYNNTPVAIRISQTRLPKALEFYIWIYDELLKENQVPFSGTDLKLNLSINVTGTPTSTISSELSKYVYGTPSSNKLDLVSLFSDKLLTNQYILIEDTDSKYLIYNGSVPEGISLGDIDEVHFLGNEALSAYKFLAKANLLIEENGTLLSSALSSLNSKVDLFFKLEDDVQLSFYSDNITNEFEIVTDTTSDVFYEYYIPNHLEYKSSIKYNNLNIKIGDVVFYIGSYIPEGGEITQRVGKSPLSLKEFLKCFYQYVPSYFDSALTKTGLVIKGDVELTAGNEFTVEKDLINQTNNAKFAVVQKYSSTEPIFKFEYKISDTDPDIYQFNFYVKGTLYNYEMSFDSSKVNGYNVSIHYQKINSSQDHIQIVELDSQKTTANEFKSRLFGSDTYGAEPTINDFIRTAEKLLDIEDFYPQILFDGGITEPSFFVYLFTLAEKLHAYVPWGSPKTADSASKIASFRNSVNIDNFRGNFICPAHWDVVADFSTVIAPHTYLVEKLVNNYNSIVNEFAPPFSKNNGIISPGGLPVCNLNKTDREALLQNQINTIVYSSSQNIWYINQNLTSQKINSALSECQNARIALIINQIAENFMKTVISEYNNDDTRRMVVESLTRLINERIVENKKFTLEDFVIQCDSNNNPPEIIEQRKIRVQIRARYPRSIAYVEIFNKVFGLTGNIENG